MNKTLFIYYTPDRRNFQVVKPTDQFKGEWAGLVENVSNSSLKDGIKNYDSFEVK